MKQAHDEQNAESGLEIRNQTIHGGSQQFADRITNIYQFKTSRRLIGAIALILLVLGIVQGIQYVSQTQAQQQEINTLLASGKGQQDAGDFALAFSSFNQALAVAERKPAGMVASLLKPMEQEKARIVQAQVAVAMVWLQDGRPGQKTFAEMVDPLLALLGAATEKASGSTKADMLAHVGWGNFLKSRDRSGPRINPEPSYRQALAIDEGNTFAHLYLGHWMLWRSENKAQAIKHLERAIGSKSANTFVLQTALAAVKNSHDNALYLFLVRKLQKSNQVFDDRQQSWIRSIYADALRSAEGDPGLSYFQSLTGHLSATEHIALIKAMPYNKNHFNGRDLVWDQSLAIFTELAGDKHAALAMWQDLATHVRQSQGHAQSDAWMNQMAQRLAQGGK